MKIHECKYHGEEHYHTGNEDISNLINAVFSIVKEHCGYVDSIIYQKINDEIKSRFQIISNTVNVERIFRMRSKVDIREVIKKDMSMGIANSLINDDQIEIVELELFNNIITEYKCSFAFLKRVDRYEK